MKHRVTLSDDELKALIIRLVPISPSDYDLKTFSTLRNLYGRFGRLLQQDANYGRKEGETK